MANLVLKYQHHSPYRSLVFESSEAATLQTEVPDTQEAAIIPLRDTVIYTQQTT